MRNPYLLQLAAKRKRYGSAYGADDLFYNELDDVYGVSSQDYRDDMVGSKETGAEKVKSGLIKGVTAIGLVTVGLFAVVMAPGIYEKMTGRTPEQALGFGGKNYGSFNKHLPLEDRIESLLAESKKQLHKNKSVDKIVGSFAMAQELIHSDEFKHDYEYNPRKKRIVEEFADYGMELSK